MTNLRDHAGRPVRYEQPHLWELKDSTDRPVRFGARWLRQAVIPSCGVPGPYSAWPGTLVVAQTVHSLDQKRTVWFVRLGRWSEGLRYPRGHYQQSLVVDAESLGPRHRKRTTGRADRRAFKAALRAAKVHWRAWGENCASVDLCRSRLAKVWDRLTGGPLTDSARVILESETEFVRLLNDQGVQAGLGHPKYARVAIFNPTVPNHVWAGALGAGKIVIAYMKTSASYQALMGLPKWANRVYYQDLTIGDEKTYFEGHSPPIGEVVSYAYRDICPGIPSQPFDHSALEPVGREQAAEFVTSRKVFLAKDASV